jgi:hypothetical protein
MTAVYFIAIAAPPVGTLLSCSGSILASWEGNSVEGFVVRMEVRLEFRERLLADVRRIADHGVEASPTLTLPPRWGGGAREDLGELGLPVEGVDPGALGVVNCQVAVEEVRADQRVAALDVLAEVGEGPLVEDFKLSREDALVFALEDLEQQRELRDLDGLGVDVNAVDVVQKDALALRRGQAPIVGAARATPTLTLPPRGRGGNGRMLARGPLLRFVCAVLVAVSIQRMLVGRRGVVLDRDRGLLRLEVRVEKLAAKLRLVVRAGAVGLAVLFEAAEEFADRVRGARGGLMYSICGQDAE